MEKSGRGVRRMEMMPVTSRNNIKFWTVEVRHVISQMLSSSDNIVYSML